jgi:hypothetical protein
MKSNAVGKSTSNIEVTNISVNGIWLLVKEHEFFLSYEDFPWFKQATVAQILNVQLFHSVHVRWPDLDVDLEMESLERLENYPLVYT